MTLSAADNIRPSYFFTLFAAIGRVVLYGICAILLFTTIDQGGPKDLLVNISVFLALTSLFILYSMEAGRVGPGTEPGWPSEVLCVVVVLSCSFVIEAYQSIPVMCGAAIILAILGLRSGYWLPKLVCMGLLIPVTGSAINHSLSPSIKSVFDPVIYALAFLAATTVFTILRRKFTLLQEFAWAAFAWVHGCLLIGSIEGSIPRVAWQAERRFNIRPERWSQSLRNWVEEHYWIIPAAVIELVWIFTILGGFYWSLVRKNSTGYKFHMIWLSVFANFAIHKHFIITGTASDIIGMVSIPFFGLVFGIAIFTLWWKTRLHFAS